MKGKRLENINECQLAAIAIEALIKGSGKANVNNKLHGIRNEAINCIMQTIKWHISVCNLYEENIDLKNIIEKNELYSKKYEIPYTLGIRTVDIFKN